MVVWVFLDEKRNVLRRRRRIFHGAVRVPIRVSRRRGRRRRRVIQVLALVETAVGGEIFGIALVVAPGWTEYDDKYDDHQRDVKRFPRRSHRASWSVVR